MTPIAAATVPLVWVDSVTPASFWLRTLVPSAPLFVVAVASPDRTPRPVARQRIRTALHSVLSELWLCNPTHVTLTTTPGEPLRAQGPHALNWGVSVSHDTGLSVAAVHRHGPVGVDLVRTATAFDWRATAHDYLGPNVASDIAAQPLSAQNETFLKAWTQHEARLKCLSLGLVEWSPALHARFNDLKTAPLDLPAEWLGTVAYR